MHDRLGDNVNPGDRPQTGELSPMSTIASSSSAPAFGSERSWLYRTPGIPSGSKDRSKKLQNPWISTAARAADPPSPPQPLAPKPIVTFETPSAPPAPPVPMAFQVQAPPAVFLNPAARVGPLYEHEAVINKADPVSALIKAILSTIVLCLGFWFATLLYVVSIVFVFPFAFNAWEGSASALPGLSIGCLIAFGMALWIGEQTKWWWGVLAFFFLPIVYAVYVYKQNRGMAVRGSGRPVAKFPMMATIGIMIGIGIFTLVIGVFSVIRNYSDEIDRGVPPFDKYSLEVPDPEQPSSF